MCTGLVLVSYLIAQCTVMGHLKLVAVTNIWKPYIRTRDQLSNYQVSKYEPATAS
jgi:hypothetical protein